jgi:hypothetical protein
MAEDGSETDAESLPEGRSKSRARKGGKSRARKVRLLSLDDLDGRTHAAQFVHDTREAIIRDIAGDEAQLSTLERVAVDNAALTAAMIRDAGVKWLQGAEVDPAAVATLANTFNRTAAALGWQRRVKDVTPDLRDYLASNRTGDSPSSAAGHSEGGR